MSMSIGLTKFLLLVTTTSANLVDILLMAVSLLGLLISQMTHYGMDKTVLLVARAVN